jgi:hypothetical protein
VVEFGTVFVLGRTSIFSEVISGVFSFSTSGVALLHFGASEYGGGFEAVALISFSGELHLA